MTNDYSKYLKIPWRDRGRDYSGCDCWGWVRLFLRDECRIEIEDLQYSSCRNVAELAHLAIIEKNKWRPIPKEEAMKGDVADLSIPGRDYHVGVMMTNSIVGHLERGTYPVMAHITSIRIKNRIRGVYRYDG